MNKSITKVCMFCGKTFTTMSKVRKCCGSHCSHMYSASVTKQRNKNFKRVYIVDDMFLRKESAEKYYFLGLMASDGNVYNTTININQSGCNGKKLIDYIRSLLNTNYKVYSYTPKRGNTVYRLDMRSKPILDDLLANNIGPNKTFNFKIPSYILNDDYKLRNFLIGYIDGDGCIGVYNSMLIISLVCNHNMFKQLIDRPVFKNAIITDKGGVVDIRFNGIKAVNFGKWLYDNIGVFKSYKYNKYKKYVDSMFNISKKMKYNFLREKILLALDENPNRGCAQYAKENNLSYWYVYGVRKKWRKLNENSK